jgi:4-amino-4-deoxy-L-arabinose transferase-like glycosyltransferase
MFAPARDPAEPRPTSTDQASSPPLHGDRLGRCALGVVGVVVLLSVVRAFAPMVWLGDIWRAADTATIARNFYDNGLQLFYPQINWGGSGPGYVEAELQLLPWLSAVLFHVFGEHAAVGRLVSVAFTLAATAAFWGLARRVLPPVAARWALIAFAVSPAVMTWGNAFMPDFLVLSFYLLTLLAFQRWLTEDRPIWLAATAAAAATAALAKPTALHVGLVLLIWLLLTDRRRFRRPGLYLAAVLALVPVTVWLWHAGNLYRTYGNTFGVISGGDNKFGSNLTLWASPQFYIGNASIETLLVFGVAGVPLAALGAWTAWKARGPVLLAAGVPSLAVFYFAVARYSMELGPQYHVFSLPFAAILTGLGVATLDQWLRRREVARRDRTGLGVVTVLALSAASLTVFTQAFIDRSDALATCARQLAELSEPDELVVVGTTSVAVDDGVANNYEEPTVFYLADRKGWVLPADRHDPTLLGRHAEQGARWFVVPDPNLVPTGSALAEWLPAHGALERSTSADGCTIWSLNGTS